MHHYPTLFVVVLLIVAGLAGCSGTTVDIEKTADGWKTSLTNYRMFQSTASSVNFTDPATGLLIEGSLNSNPEVAQAAEFNQMLMGMAIKGMQLSAPGP